MRDAQAGGGHEEERRTLARLMGFGDASGDAALAAPVAGMAAEPARYAVYAVREEPGGLLLIVRYTVIGGEWSHRQVVAYGPPREALQVMEAWTVRDREEGLDPRAFEIGEGEREKVLL